jgi:hypothetical protein
MTHIKPVYSTVKELEFHPYNTYIYKYNHIHTTYYKTIYLEQLIFMSQNFSELLRLAPRYRCWAARGSSRQHQTGTVVTSGAAFQQLRGTWTWRAGEKAETWLKNGGWFTSKTIAKL